MSEASVVATVIKSVPDLTRLSMSLFWMYINLGRRVRKARRAFEKQLISQGMSEDDAKRLSRCFVELKNNITNMLKQGVVGGFR